MRDVLRKWLMIFGVVMCCAPLASAQSISPLDHERTGGPYVPTPNMIVDLMLEVAKVTDRDHVVDLGSGDGVIVLTAAHRHGSSGYGVDIDSELVQLSNQRARSMGLAGRVIFETKDIFRADLSKATVVTLYLLPEMMQALLPKLFRELRPGTRIVSHDYHFDSWPHDYTVTIKSPEKEMVSGLPEADIYLWIVPAKISGSWRLSIDGGDEYELKLRQDYGGVSRDLSQGLSHIPFTDIEVSGAEISFVRNHRNERQIFRGRVEGDLMAGTVDLGEGRMVRWRAVRGKTS